MADLNLIFLGAPGAGKGTQAQRLREERHLPYVATGDMLREAVRTGTQLGREAAQHMNRGELVPDGVVIGIVAERLAQPDAGCGFILDGFPRTVPQADALKAELERLGRPLTAVIFIDVSDEEVVRRLSGRRVCEKEGHSYHVEFDPPKRDGVCDSDGSKLLIRDDDQPATVCRRLETYHAKTSPLIEYYRREGLLRTVGGDVPPQIVAERVRELVSELDRAA